MVQRRLRRREGVASGAVARAAWRNGAAVGKRWRQRVGVKRSAPCSRCVGESHWGRRIAETLLVARHGVVNVMMVMASSWGAPLVEAKGWVESGHARGAPLW